MAALRLVQTPRQRPTTPLVSSSSELTPALLRAAAAGEGAARRAFVVCYQHRVVTVCTRLLADPRAGEDAAQETFLRAFNALPRFDPKGPARCSTWLLTIATRLCIDERRRQRRQPGHDDVDVATLQADGHGALDVVAHKELIGRLQRGLAGLPDGQREVFVLRVLAERSVEETATVLGIDTGTVKSRLARAREALAPLLAPGGAP